MIVLTEESVIISYNAPFPKESLGCLRKGLVQLLAHLNTLAGNYDNSCNCGQSDCVFEVYSFLMELLEDPNTPALSKDNKAFELC